MHRLRRSLLAGCVVAGGLLAVPPAHATPEPWGTFCGLTSVSDPTAEQGTMSGTISGGPIVLGDDAAAALRDATVICEVRVNGASSASAAAAGTGAVVVWPRPVSYVASSADIVEICTIVVSGDGTVEDCDVAITIELPLGTGKRDPDGRAHQGGRKNKAPAAATTTQPFRPSGTIEISSTGGPVTYSYSGFNPPLAQWSCPTPAAGSATCVPPAAPLGYHNVCGHVGVAATSYTPGAVSGTSACASPPYATAASVGPTATASTGSADPNADFPWTCAASAPEAAAWVVTCTVG